jgi:hypothetical protein
VGFVAALIITAIIMLFFALSGWVWFWGLFLALFALFVVFSTLGKVLLHLIMWSLVGFILFALVFL